MPDITGGISLNGQMQKSRTLRGFMIALYPNSVQAVHRIPQLSLAN
jgi:hypothetical protein